MRQPVQRPQENRLLPRKRGVFPAFYAVVCSTGFSRKWLGRFRPIPPKGRTNSGLPVFISPMALTLDFWFRNVLANKINYVTLPPGGSEAHRRGGQNYEDSLPLTALSAA